MAAETFRFRQETAKTARRRVLSIRGGQGETLVPLTATAGGDERRVYESEAGIAMAAATWRFMQETAKKAGRRVLGIRGGQGETLVPPTAGAGGDEEFV